jgi:hypothetical protein
MQTVTHSTDISLVSDSGKSCFVVWPLHGAELLWWFEAVRRGAVISVFGSKDLRSCLAL